MKKIILFITILLGVNMLSYSEIDSYEMENQAKKEIIKELSLFYGGDKKIYSKGVHKQNINFILSEVQPEGAKKIEYDFKTILNGQIIDLNIDEKIEFKNIMDLEKLKVTGKTYKNSSVDFKKNNENLEISFSSIGEYKISFTDRDKVIKEIIIRKNAKYIPLAKDIEKNIEEAYNNIDFKFLNDNLLLLETFFPDSENIEKGLFYALELNQKNKNYDMVRKNSKTLVSRYKLSDEKEEEIINIYTDALKKLGKVDEYLEFLAKLSNYKEKYEIEYLDASIEYERYSSKAIKLAETQVLTEPISKTLVYLGDYYYHLKDYNKAIGYYKKGEDLEKLTLIYLETGDKTNLETLKSSATSEQLEKINQIEMKYLEQKKLESYIETAEKYVQQGRLQEAEFYYKRALGKDLHLDLKSNIYYKLVDLYYKLDEFKLAEENLKFVDIKVLNEKYLGNYYYLGGMICYNLENYNESIKYFKKLIKNFPNTTLSNRGRIYILKIEKINKNKLKEEVENESNSWRK